MDDSLNQNQGQGAYPDPNDQQPGDQSVPPSPQAMPSPQFQQPQAPQPQTPQPQPSQQPGDQPAAVQSERPPLRIDDALLAELGLASLPEVERKALQKHIYETLEMNVGMRLADQMSNEQLDEFEQYFNARDDAGAFRWLETNFPNYKDIVADEFEKLKGEVAQNAPHIVAASQQAASSQGMSTDQAQSQQNPSSDQTGPSAPQAPPNFGQ
jgi:hypothetical protein